MSLKLCKRKYGYLGNGLRNDRSCNRVSFCTCWIDDNDHLYRGPDVPDIQNRLHQVHFLPCRNENDCVKDSPTDLVNGPAAITDFCHNASGTGKALFHRLTAFGTNQQGSVKTALHLTTETNIPRRAAGRSCRSRGRLALAQLLEAIKMPGMRMVVQDEASVENSKGIVLSNGPMREVYECA